MAKNKKVVPQKPVIELWQYLLVVLIIILPAVGFYGGIKYEQKNGLAKENSVSPTSKFTPDTLVIIRVENKANNLPLLIKTITDKTKVMTLYNEMYSLPYGPTGEINCPAEFYTNYTLDFFQDTNQVLNATFNPTGCTIVQISNEKARWAMNSQGQIFIKNLQKTLELSNTDFYGR
jgi:hypothetical protein